MSRSQPSPAAHLSELSQTWPELPCRTQFSQLDMRIQGDCVIVYLDGTEASYLSFSDPRLLEFEYHQHMYVALRQHLDSATSFVNALHLGGAGCALARAWHAAFSKGAPRFSQTVCEVDSVLAEGARTWFDLPRSPGLKIRAQDGAEAVVSSRPEAWQVIVRDAFIAGKVPSSLANSSFYEACFRALRPDGLYLANVADLNLEDGKRITVGQGAKARQAFEAEAEWAYQAGFKAVAAIADPRVWRGKRHGNIVLAARQQPWDFEELRRATVRLPLPAGAFSPGQK